MIQYQGCILFEMESNKQDKVQMIIRKNLYQNNLFKEWNKEKAYNKFHSNHYDWWAFPVNTQSSYGTKFQVEGKDKIRFMKCKQFIQGLRSNSILVCLSWGYDLLKGEEIETKVKDQKWQNWPIRLYKMANSLEYFQQLDLHEKAIKFGCSLLNKGYQLRYKKDLSAYFIRCHCNYSKKKQNIQGNKINAEDEVRQKFTNLSFKAEESEKHIKQNAHLYQQKPKQEKKKIQRIQHKK